MVGSQNQRKRSMGQKNKEKCMAMISRYDAWDREERVKKEWWGYKTKALEDWHKLPRKKIEAQGHII
jgi:hypothetical protein